MISVTTVGGPGRLAVTGRGANGGAAQVMCGAGRSCRQCGAELRSGAESCGICGSAFASIDELLDQAVSALNRGDRVGATALAGQVLAVDKDNADAEDLLAAPSDAGEIRRLTILFADLVDSTALSTRVGPETYRLVVGRYREQVQRIVDRYEGHIGSTKGDGLLAVFGHPLAHEDDVRRAVQAGLEITRDVARLAERAQTRFGIDIAVRVGVHRGLVYLDTTQDDIYGLAANLAARVSGLAPPGSVVVSDVVEPLVCRDFELRELPAAPVKGIEGLITHYRVVGERAVRTRLLGPLVGRERELAVLQENWARTRAGLLATPGIVYQGEPGIGKSRLATAAIELAERDGGVVLELAGSPFHADVGLHPVRMLIEHRSGITRATDPRNRLRLLESEIITRALDPVAVTPLLAPVLGIAPENGYEAVAADGPRLQELIAEAVRAYLLACLGDGPGLVVAEDMHWFDQSTVGLLASLLSAGDGRLLVVMTGRDSMRLPQGLPLTVFQLNSLTNEQADQLILALNPAVTADQRAAVRGRCDGVPFYIEQVVAGLGIASTAPAVVPEALYEPLFARLRASANAVPVVEAAAVIGREVDRRILGAAVTLDATEVDSVIRQLEDALVLEPWGEDGWRFRHELLREVAIELAPPTVRRDLHSRVADALVNESGGDPDWRLVASHYEKAERTADAAEAYRRAAGRASQRGALAEARNYLTEALKHVERAAPGPERDRQELILRLERGQLATAAEGFSSRAAVTDLGSCLQLAGTDLEDDRVFATLDSLMNYYVVRAELDQMDRVVELMRGGVDRGREWLRPLIDGASGLAAFLRGEFGTARPLLEAWVRFVAKNYDDIEPVWFNPNDALVIARTVVALDRMVQGDREGAEAELTAAAGDAERLPSPKGPYSIAQVRFIQVWVYTEADQLDRAEMLAAELVNLSDKHGFEAWRVLGATQQGCVRGLLMLGRKEVDVQRLSACLEGVPELVDTWRSMELNIYLTAYDAILGRLLMAAGRRGDARRRLDMGLALADRTGMHFYDAELLRLRAQTEPDPDARAVGLARALALARSQGALLFELRAALDDFALRGRVAREALIESVSQFPAGSAWPELARAKALLAQGDPGGGAPQGGGQ